MEDILNNKAKEFFEEWYEPPLVTACKDGCMVELNFDSMPLNMQWGLYQDWADSLGFSLSIQQDGKTYYAELSLMDYDIEIGNLLFESEWLKTRNGAREQAIKQLNNLINEKEKDNKED